MSTERGILSRAKDYFSGPGRGDRRIYLAGQIGFIIDCILSFKYGKDLDLGRGAAAGAQYAFLIFAPLLATWVASTSMYLREKRIEENKPKEEGVIVEIQDYLRQVREEK